MPSSEAHVRAALNNQATIDYLLAGGVVHAPWVVTVAFYKALHVVEAVLARQRHRCTRTSTLAGSCT